MRILEKITNKLLDWTQNLLNKLYLKEGLSDYVLDNQVQLNEERHKNDFFDKSKVIYTDEDGNWVQ